METADDPSEPASSTTDTDASAPPQEWSPPDPTELEENDDTDDEGMDPFESPSVDDTDPETESSAPSQEPEDTGTDTFEPEPIEDPDSFDTGETDPFVSEPGDAGDESLVDPTADPDESEDADVGGFDVDNDDDPLSDALDDEQSK
jgi:hypothetical protein